MEKAEWESIKVYNVKLGTVLLPTGKQGLIYSAVFYEAGMRRGNLQVRTWPSKSLLFSFFFFSHSFFSSIYACSVLLFKEFSSGFVFLFLRFFIFTGIAIFSYLPNRVGRAGLVSHIVRHDATPSHMHN
jgi:hypothetical protein